MHLRTTLRPRLSSCTSTHAIRGWKIFVDKLQQAKPLAYRSTPLRQAPLGKVVPTAQSFAGLVCLVFHPDRSVVRLLQQASIRESTRLRDPLRVWSKLGPDRYCCSGRITSPFCTGLVGIWALVMIPHKDYSAVFVRPNTMTCAALPFHVKSWTHSERFPFLAHARCSPDRAPH